MIDKNDPRLTAYLLDELDDDNAAEVQAAIEASDELREHVDGLRLMIGVLNESLGETSNVELAEDQLAAIDLATNVSVAAASQPDKADDRRIRWRNLVLAALVLYAVGISIFAFHKPPIELASGVQHNDVPADFVIDDPSNLSLEIQNSTSVHDEEPVDSLTRRINPSGSQEVALRQSSPSEEGHASEEELSQLVDTFDDLVENRRFQEAEVVAKAVSDLKPRSTLARQMSVVAEAGTRAGNEAQPKDVFSRSMIDIDRASLPLEFNDPRSWRDLTIRRPTEPVEDMAASNVEFGDRTQRSTAIGGQGFSEDATANQPSRDPFGGSVGGQELSEDVVLKDGRTIVRGTLAYNPPGDFELQDSGGDLLQQVELERNRSQGRLNAEVRLDIRRAQGQVRTNPVGVARQLKTTLSAVANAPNVDSRLREELESKLRSAIEIASEREADFIEDQFNLEQRQAAATSTANRAQEAADAIDPQRLDSAKQRVSAGRPHEKTQGDEAEQRADIPADALMLTVTPRIIIDEEEELPLTGFDPETRELELKESEKRKAEQVALTKARKLKLAKQRAIEKERERIRTWKPASAATNRARLSVGHHDDLALSARDTYVRIDGFRARVFFDCYYYNDRPQQLEGQFMLRLPSDAALHYFAFGPTNLPAPKPTPSAGKPGQLAHMKPTADASLRSLRDLTSKDGSDLARRAAQPDFAQPTNTTFGLVRTARVAPRQKAALAYDETVRRRVDPALVEWAGPGIFQTKVFPLMPNKLHRIVVGYDIMLTDDGDDRVFTLDLPEGEAGGRVEFDIAATPGTQATITPTTDAFISNDRAYYRFQNALPRAYTVRLTGSKSVVLNSGKHTNTRSAGGDEAYFAARIKANLPDAAADLGSDRAVFLLDTSWSDRPAAFSRRLKLLKSILAENRSELKEFAVMMFNVEQRWWRSEFTKNNKKNVNEFLKDADTIALEGATDLYTALATAKTAWYATNKESRQNEADSMPNFFLLSDASPTWGRVDLASLADPIRQDASGNGGSLFAYHLAGHASDKTTMQWLADASGGAVFDVAEEADLASVAVAHRSRPWQVVNVSAKGADQVLIQGAAKTVYPNQTLTIAGSGRLDGPLEIQLRRGKETQTLAFQPEHSIASPSAARLFGQLAVERLEPHAADLEEITIAFARYFRVPGRTCSMVMLEGPEDYKRFEVDVPPAEDQLVIASTSVTAAIRERESEQAQLRQQPQARFTAWVESLQAASLVKVPTALRLAMKRLPQESFGFNAYPLKCKSWKTKHVSTDFADELKLDAPGFEAVMNEAERKREVFGSDDAIKTASTLVEAKPSDVDTLRSVAFRAIAWQRSDQAAPLLWRLAQARPYQPQCLLLLGRAMSESDDTDSAMVCYDLVCNGNWNQRWSSGAKHIAEVELMHLLERVDCGEIKSAVPQYCRARLRQLRDKWSDEGLDMAVVMHWNTDRTDVDLHVTDPSGEECNYSHKTTKAGGRITQDITEGLGPEMFSLKTAPEGEYTVEAKYYSTDANRTKAPTESLLTVIRNVGRTNSAATTKRITLKGKGEKQVVMKTTVKH